MHKILDHFFQKMFIIIINCKKNIPAVKKKVGNFDL